MGTQTAADKKKLKLRTGQTVRVGFVFLAICAFWQMYNNVIPLMLTNTFHMNETFSGAIMAADNVLGIFLLPLFGSLSDRMNSRMGKRKPFILCGTVISVFLMLLIPFLDNRFFANPSTAIRVIFICVLGCLLVSMGTYRSPAVALMPDVTPKPLRSQGNAVINLMGAIGSILYLIVASVLYSSSRTEGLEHVDYTALFMVVAGIMILSLIIVMFTVDEVRLNREMIEYDRLHPEEDLTEESPEGQRVLPPEVKRSLLFLLSSIALWYIGYNAVETWFTTYAVKIWGMSLGSASLCLTIVSIGAIVSFIPVGSISARFGRKRMIILGTILLTACFASYAAAGFFLKSFHPALYAVFALVGFAWAAINVNSLPMVLEMCEESDIGKYTGYYYTFSMAAQIITPITAGFLMNRIGYMSLFVYAALSVFFSFLTMSMVRHGDVSS